MIERAASLQRPSVQNSVPNFLEDAHRLEGQVRQVLLGQDQVIREVLIALLSGGHVLLEGVPGLGKTLLVRSLASSLDLSFSRIQFTPDLMPADVTGTTILREDEDGRRFFTFQSGPLFANLLLADEINRATPKTQSALLEAMQEHTVTVGKETYDLPEPFFVLATQNPLEMEGTYPLPEAQLDRFLIKTLVPFPAPEVLRQIAVQTEDSRKIERSVLDASRLVDMMRLAEEVPIATPVIDYAVALVRATHPTSTDFDVVKRYVRAGVSPRGLQGLIKAAKVRALLEERYNASLEDIRLVALPCLRHRILINFEGDAEGVDADQVVGQLLEQLPQP